MIGRLAFWLAGARWTIAGLALVALAGVLAAQRLDAAHMRTRAAQAEASGWKAKAAALQNALAVERQMTEAGVRQGEQDARQIAQLTADRARLERLLRDRPARPADAGSDPAPAGGSSAGADGVAAGATGADLYRDDGLFLVWLAAAADRQRVQLESCLQQYESAREALKDVARE